MSLTEAFSSGGILGTGGKDQRKDSTHNPTLASFLAGLPSASDDLLVQNLALSIFERCPDIVPLYLEAPPFSLEPKLNLKFLTTGQWPRGRMFRLQCA